MPKRRKPIEFTEIQKKFVIENYDKLSNATMAKMLHMKFTTFSGKVHDLGLYRFKIESWWTEEQKKFLIDHYKQIGNVELAEIYNSKWPRGKKWTIKHIEKKLTLLNLRRTKEDLRKVKIRNIGRGSWKNMSTWDTRGAIPTGAIRVWYFGGNKRWPSKVIKTDVGYLIYSRYLWEKHFGAIPKDHIVTFKDRNPLNVTIDNLVLVDRSANARRDLRKYPEQVRNVEKLLKKFNQLIKEKS